MNGKQWKRTIILSVCSLIFLSSGLQIISCGATNESGGDKLKWTVSDDGKTLTISGRGEMKDYESNMSRPSGWDMCEKVIIEDGVTSIGDSAFFDVITL